MATKTSSASLVNTMKGMWSITEEHPHDIFADNEVIKNVHNVYMMALPRCSAIRAGASGFENAFDPDDHENVYMEAALQLALKSISVVRREFQAAKIRGEMVGSEYDSEPVKCYIEAVRGNRPDPNADEYDYGNTPETVGARRFMRGVPDNVPIIEYRLWIFILQAHVKIDFGRIFFDLIDAANKEYNIKVGGGSTTGGQSSAGGGGGGADSADVGISMSSYGGSTDSATRFGRHLGENERWKLIHSLSLWSQICDMNIGFRRLTRPDTMARILSVKTDVDKNPANPLYSMSPYLYFQHPHEFAYEPQAYLSNYMKSDNCQRWTFPVPDCVVRVSASDEPIARFRMKVFPDYQVRSIGDEAIDGMARRKRERDTALLERKKIGRGNNAVNRRHMVHRPLSFGDAGDIDEFSDIIAAGGGAASEDPFGDDIMRDLGVDGGGGAQMPPPAAGQAAGGGKERADIMAVISSIPETTPDGSFELYDHQVLMREDFEGSTSLAAQKLLSATDRPDRSDFHRVRYTGALLRSKLRELVSSHEQPRDELRKAYLSNQRRVMRMYEDLCTGNTSNISKQGCEINRWFQARANDDRSWLGAENPLIDGNMSIFGNLIARRMLRLEASMFVTNAHLIIMTLSFGSLDAYRHEFDLHFNALLTGDNSTGKSFIERMLQRLRMDDTVTKVDDESGRANYVDTDHNDQINYCEEIKPDQFRDGRHGGDDTKESQLKEYLTTMYRTYKVFYKEPNGRRSQRIVYSQQIATLIGATNLYPEQLSDPILSRFTCFPIVQSWRPDRVTADMQGVEKRLDDDARQRQHEFIEEMCAEQYLHFHVEKLISSHALTDITLVAFDVVKQLFNGYLRSRYAIDLRMRTIERASYLARKFVISARCEALFSTPYSRYYKKPFRIAQLAALDPLLYDDEEIACFALESMRHEIVDKTRPHFISIANSSYVEHEIKRVLAAAATSDVEMRMRSVYLMPTSYVLLSKFGNDMDAEADLAAAGGGGAAGAGATGDASMSQNKRRRLDAAAATSAERRRRGGGFGGRASGEGTNDVVKRVLARTEFSEEQMYAYVRLPANYKLVSERVSAVSRSSSMLLTEEKCRKIMKSMSKEFIRSPQYAWNSVTHAPEIDETRNQATIPALLYTNDSVYIAVVLLKCEDIITDALNHCRSVLLKEDRKYISGRQVSDERPHLLQTRFVAKHSGTTHEFTDYAQQITASTIFAYKSFGESDSPEKVLERINVAQERVGYHYDELSRRARARAIFLDPDVDASDTGTCSLRPYEQYARELTPPDDTTTTRRRRYVLDMQCDYPRTIYELDQKAQRRGAKPPQPPVAAPMERRVEREEEPDMERRVEREEEPDMEREVEQQVESDMEREVESDMEREVEPDMEREVEQEVEPNVEPIIEPNVEPARKRRGVGGAQPPKSRWGAGMSRSVLRAIQEASDDCMLEEDVH